LIGFIELRPSPGLPRSTSIADPGGTPSQAWLAVLARTTFVNIS
jgi:hypothetical protein